MKKILLSLFIFAGLCAPRLAKAQSFSIQSDTVTANVTGPATIYNFIINNQHSPLVLKWRVVATNFPSDWLTSAAFGICDNSSCYPNTGPNWLWNETTSSGATFTTLGYTDTTTHGIFDLSLNLTGVSNGSHYVTINISDPATSYGRQMTYVINKFPAAVPVVKAEGDINIYPNPASNELNVVYDAAADVKTISVYSIIGKLMTVYKVTGNSGANLNLENLSSGVYFVRLMNGHGELVATKKFTKQ